MDILIGIVIGLSIGIVNSFLVKKKYKKKLKVVNGQLKKIKDVISVK